ncbi:hypothetical protein ABZP36_007254 [Zizania latifolia]
MAITSAADAFLILEFVIGHRPVPNSVFTSLLVSLPSVSPQSSPRLRTGLALRVLDAALSDGVDAPALLHKAMAVLTDPHLAPYFPQRLFAPASADNTPAAAVANLRRLLDVAWASLPPSTLEIAADRIAGAGALHTWENADHALRAKLRLLVGESTEREILGKLKQYASTNHPLMVPEVDNAPQTHGGNDSVCAQENDKAGLIKQNAEADRSQEDITRHQQESVQGAPNTQLKERLVTRTAVRGKDCNASVTAVGESTEREILGKLKQYASTNHPVMVPEVDDAPQTDGGNDSVCAQENDKAGLIKQNAEADRSQEDITRHQQESVQGAPNAQLKERLVTRTAVSGKDCDITEQIEDTTPHVTGQSAPDNNKNHQVTGSKRNLMERNPTASTYEHIGKAFVQYYDGYFLIIFEVQWGDDLGDSDAERSATKRQLPIFQNKTKPSPTAAKKTRKTWSEIQEKTLLEGVKKYGKGNWKDIKMAYPDVFANRSTVDLKDKFRNMERHMCV